MSKDELNKGGVLGGEKGLSPASIDHSVAEAREKASQIMSDIDKTVIDFRAQKASEDPDSVRELEELTKSKKTVIQEVLDDDSEGIQAAIENVNTPEYKEAQKYASQVREKIDGIITLIIDDRLRGKLRNELDKISKSFWFFCKEMAFNDMEEFDYNSKISMMESKYQKVLAEIDAISADFLAKDKKKVPNHEVSKVALVENPAGVTSGDWHIETSKQDESKVSNEADSQSAIVEPKNINSVLEDNVQATDQGSDRFQQLENLHRTITEESAKKKFSLGKLNRKKRIIESTISSDASQEMPLALDNDFSYNQAQSWEALYLALSNKLGSAAEPIMDRLRLVELGDRSTPEELSKTEGMTPEIIAAVAGLRHKSFEESHEDFQYFENLYNYIERIILPARAKEIIKNIEAFRAGKISEEVLVAGLQPLYSGWVVPEIKRLSEKEAEGSTASVIQSPVVPEQTPESVKSAEIESESSEESNVPEPEIVDVPKNTPTQSTEPVNQESVPTPEPSPEAIPEKSELEPVKSEPSVVSESVPVPDSTLEEVNNLTDARNQYFELVKNRKKIFSRDRKFIVGRQKDEAQDELDQAHDDYESLKQQQAIKLIESLKAKGEKDPAKLVDAYIKFLQNEESNVDDLAGAGDKTKFNKFKEWWKRHTKARIALGAGLFAVGAGATVASGGVLGGLAGAVSSSIFATTGFAAARGISSGGGTYMGLEGVIDLKSKKLGQKGLIDEVDGNNFYKYYARNKEGDKVILEESDVSREKKAAFEENLKQLSLQDLGAELARLRHMGLEKGVGFADAGRQGKSQAEAAQVLEKVYYEKLRQSILASEVLKKKDSKKIKTADQGQEIVTEQTPGQIAAEKEAKAARLLEVLKMKTEDERSGTLISEADKYRTKSMIRHGVAASLGIGMGVLSGVMAEKMMAAHAAKEAAKETATAAVQGAAQQTVEEGAKNVNYVVEVKPGDSLWHIIGEKLHEGMGDAKWNALGEAGQTHAIDQIKDAVGAHPEAFGLHDIDKLSPGQHIDLSSLLGHQGALEHVTEGVQAMQAAGGEANILANNDALEAAARAGIHLTTENVDMVSNEIRNFGTGFLSSDGAIHEWVLNGQAVDRLADGSFVLTESHQVVSPDQLANVLNHAKESAQHFVDLESTAKATADVAVTQAAEQVKVVADATAETAAQQQAVTTFLNEGGTYNHGIFETAKDLGQIDALVTKVVTTGNTEQISNFIHDYAANMGWSADKTNVFVGALQHGDKLDFTAAGIDLNSPQIISENMKVFENAALGSFSKVKDMPSGHWMVAKLGDTYALVQKYHSGIWPIRSDHWLIDTNGNRTTDIVKLDDESMKQAFAKGIDVVKKVIAESAGKTPPDIFKSPR